MSEKSKDKKNEIINFLKRPLLYILFFCAFAQQMAYEFYKKNIIFPDTASYMNYGHNISDTRTPIYPYFIKLIRKLFGEENIYNSIVFVQYILFFISIIIFYLAVKKICKSKLLTNISTIIYGASPFIFIWNNIVMTESLAMCAVTLLAYMTISYLKKPNIFFAYFIGIYIFGLIMLRPAFIYIVVIYLLFWIIRYFTNKSEIKNNIIGSVSMLICIILVLLYSLLIKVNYGNFEITNVSTANKVANIIESGTYVSGDNKNIIDMINNELKGRNYKEDFWSSTYKAINNFEKRDIDQYCSSVYKNDTKRYLFYILQNTLILGEKSVGIRGAFNTQDYSSVKYKTLYFYDNMILPINFMHLYLIILISIIFLFILLFKNKKIEWILAFLISMIVANLFTTIVGAPMDYQRLFSSSIPLVIILIAYLIQMLLNNVNFKKICNKILEIK